MCTTDFDFSKSLNSCDAKQGPLSDTIVSGHQYSDMIKRYMSATAFPVYDLSFLTIGNLDV